jgi:ATP-dependent Lon protease
MSKYTPDVFTVMTDTESTYEQLLKTKVSSELPILTLRNTVLFPGTIIPIVVARESSKRLIEDYRNAEKRALGVVCQLYPDVDEPTFDDLQKSGTYANILSIDEKSDGSMSILVQGINRFVIKQHLQTEPYLIAKVRKTPEILNDGNTEEFEVLMQSIKKQIHNLGEITGDGNAEKLEYPYRFTNDPIILLNLLCTQLPFSTEEKIDLFEETNLLTRGYQLSKVLNEHIRKAEILQHIIHETQRDMDKQQRDYFLQMEMHKIQAQLNEDGEGNSDIEKLRNKLEELEMMTYNPELQGHLIKEILKLNRIPQQSPDYNVLYNYLTTVLSLPWKPEETKEISIRKAKSTLDKDHYGLEKVKERILEHLVVMKERHDSKAPILCLYGPPGVGKTSLGKSIATATGREYIRVSLGGIHDESEIRGHRKTYIGAMPGRIIKSLIKVKSSTPVMVLDEIDKLGMNSNNGDPSSALLEVLDPEQNKTFHDNFVDLDFDLSKVMFIATANSLNTIPHALLDRMEIIEVSGYLAEEKLEIAKQHLIPKQLEECGIANKPETIHFSKQAIAYLIENYTRESGVRQLEKQINKVLRKILYKQYMENTELGKKPLRPEDITELLGKPIYNRDIYQGNQYAGVVTGLAWTSVGGEILFIETSLSKARAGKLTLTGNLGDVMKESAIIALEYIKAHADLWNIDFRLLEQWNIHVHVPEGATPKDGPSAGVTMVTSMVSALTQRKVRGNLAMTGEITLRGKVLPVGGIKEKILAAKRAGITDIILCKDNRKDIEEIKEIYVKGVTFHYVENIKEVIDLALLDEKVEHAVEFTYFEEEKKDKQ